MRLLVTSLIVGAAVWSSSATAQQMNAERFYERATKLKAKGPMALFSAGEIKALMNEGKAAGAAARANRLAAAKAGAAPRYCPPEGVHGMNSNEFMSRLAQIPEAERRRIDMAEAMTLILERKYPCR